MKHSIIKSLKSEQKQKIMIRYELNEEAQPTQITLGLLHRDFPQCFKRTEGKFDIAAFRELLTDKVDLIKEGSGFNFVKNYASLLASMDTTTVLVPDLGT